MVEELSLVRFCVMNFWAILMSSRPFHPISTILIKLVQALINAETEPDKKVQARVKWIYEHTHEKVMAHLSIIELVVFRNLQKGVNKEIEIGDNTFLLAELYNILDEISMELSGITMNIAKKYNIDLPLINMGGRSNIQGINFEEEK